MSETRHTRKKVVPCPQYLAFHDGLEAAWGYWSYSGKSIDIWIDPMDKDAPGRRIHFRITRRMFEAIAKAKGQL